jgi:hypothetical protein
MAGINQLKAYVGLQPSELSERYLEASRHGQAMRVAGAYIDGMFLILINIVWSHYDLHRALEL